MKKYDVVSLDNSKQINGYVKVVEIPIYEDEQNGYDFPDNSYNFEMDVYWISAWGGKSKWAKFGIALQRNTGCRINQLSTNINDDIPDKAIAYVVNKTHIDIYVSSDGTLTRKIACDISHSHSPRIILTSGNPIIEISDLNAVYLNNTSFKLSNIDISNLSNGYFYFSSSTDSSAINTIKLDDFDSSKKWIIKFKNIRNNIVYGKEIFITNGNLIVKDLYGETNNITATFDNSTGILTFSRLEWYSINYYEIWHN